MSEIRASVDQHFNITRINTLLLLTTAGGWIVFVTILSAQPQPVGSVPHWFALAAITAAAMMATAAGYLLVKQPSLRNARAVMLTSSLIVWSTAGLFWPPAAIIFSLLSTSIYALLTLLISPQQARPYAFLPLLSLWVVAGAVSLPAVIPVAMILALHLFLAETVLLPLEEKQREAAGKLIYLTDRLQATDEERRHAAALYEKRIAKLCAELDEALTYPQPPPANRDIPPVPGELHLAEENQEMDAEELLQTAAHALEHLLQSRNVQIRIHPTVELIGETHESAA